MLEREIRITSKGNNKINLKVIPGHFATSHSHINYYMDMTTLKVRQSEAAEVAKTMAKCYKYNTIVDTIICMDGCEIIGTHLAQDLTDAGIMSMNAHQSLYVITPETDSDGQLIFRDNIQPMVRDKNVILLLASATTGRTIAKSLECIQYYGGKVQGISAIFSATTEIHGQQVNSIFDSSDFLGYKSYPKTDCPLCNESVKLDAIVNGYGYSML